MSGRPVGAPARAWRRHVPAALALGIGVLITAAVFVLLSGLEDARVRGVFERDAAVRAVTLDHHAQVTLDDLYFVEVFMRLGIAPTRRQFREFVVSALARQPGVQAFNWVPRVSDAMRDAHERAIRTEGFPDYRITERDADGRTVPSRRRAEYFPVRGWSRRTARSAAWSCAPAGTTRSWSSTAPASIAAWRDVRSRRARR